MTKEQPDGMKNVTLTLDNATVETLRRVAEETTGTANASMGARLLAKAWREEKDRSK